MTTMLAFDARGRLTLPRRLREGLGSRVVAIQTPHGVVLHPVPSHVRLPGKAKDVSGESGASAEA